ncbi:hypothetical protein D1224_03390 [Henriciella barbarensis]|uniref:Uncharacterized protein n=1 Tax=Henriciella barbarensis TaxID=86342 RepID=A0A399QYM8_9PROT|nr:hypothetical protein [Henriciella barbarensis]RIJ23334.1 hypothetical protein D1224_03390 [Henriciella barbarensis]
MVSDFENLERQLPYYLTQGRDALLKELKAFFTSQQGHYYYEGPNDEIYQGDAWRGLEFYHFDTGKKITARAIVLSNTCDVAPENRRVFPRRITFAPLTPFSQYRSALVNFGWSDSQIEPHLEDIKKQRITSVFHLPSGGGLEEDHLARLDDIHSVPAAAHEKNAEREKLFTLSQFGHYVFLFKLSIHFCRFQEEIVRSPEQSETAIFGQA